MPLSVSPAVRARSLWQATQCVSINWRGDEEATEGAGCDGEDTGVRALETGRKLTSTATMRSAGTAALPMDTWNFIKYKCGDDKPGVDWRRTVFTDYADYADGRSGRARLNRARHLVDGRPSASSRAWSNTMPAHVSGLVFDGALDQHRGRSPPTVDKVVCTCFQRGNALRYLRRE